MADFYPVIKIHRKRGDIMQRKSQTSQDVQTQAPPESQFSRLVRGLVCDVIDA